MERINVAVRARPLSQEDSKTSSMANLRQLHFHHQQLLQIRFRSDFRRRLQHISGLSGSHSRNCLRSRSWFQRSTRASAAVIAVHDIFRPRSKAINIPIVTRLQCATRNPLDFILTQN